ncbi:MAG TPA: glycosyltransferase family 4 protein [Thermomicrobiales bacterium]|nr:glycosyltransferase family 4 protein [Thermomicrobiales bacterium]
MSRAEAVVVEAGEAPAAVEQRWAGLGRAPRVALYNVTTTTKLGGVETFVWELARHLAARGVPVDVLGGRETRRPVAQAAPGVRVRRAPFVRREWLRRAPGLARQYGATKLAERLTFGATALPLLLRGDYDILHIQKPFDLPVGALVRRLRRGRTRLVFGCHGRDFFPGDRRWTGAVDVTVSCSATNAAEIAARYGLAPRVIYNGIDPARFAPRPADPALRARLAGGADRPVLLCVGRLVRWKGFEYAIEALALGQHEPAPALAIAGEGPYRPDLERLAAARGVADRVTFLGAWPHAAMPDLYAACDLLLGTSFVNETFGISLCEALAGERPVVAADFGGFREVVRDGETGLLVPPQDPAALAAAVDALLADPARRRAYGVAGRRDVAARFSWDAVVGRVLDAYEEAIGRR